MQGHESGADRPVFQRTGETPFMTSRGRSGERRTLEIAGTLSDELFCAWYRPVGQQKIAK